MIPSGIEFQTIRLSLRIKKDDFSYINYTDENLHATF